MQPSFGSTPTNAYRPITRITITLLILALLLPGSAALSAPDTPAAVGDYAVVLTGERPPSGGIDESGYIEVPYHVVLNPTGGALTIEAWVKRNANGRNETIVGNGRAASYWFGFNDSGKLSFTPRGWQGIVDGNAVVAAGVWTHVAVTYDGQTRRYYINGNLDLSTNSKPGAIQPAPSGEPLGIGFDRNDTITPNYFGGLIDNVRIFKAVRAGEEIRYSMFHEATFGYAGLVAEWQMNGNATDAVSSHDGIHRGKVIYTNEGAIPHDIRIPQVSGAITLDGNCNDAAYSSATNVTFDATPVSLLHTADDLWICFKNLGTIKKAATIYLDPDFTRVDPAQTEHLRLSVDDANTISAREGDGTNSYVATTRADGLWDAKYLSAGGIVPIVSAEFRISSGLVGGWQHVIGLAIDKNNGTRDSWRYWPVFASSSSPSTWSIATLAGTGASRSFKGSVVYQPPDVLAEPIGIPNVEIRVIGSDGSGGEAVVSVTKSNAIGRFFAATNDNYAEHRLELGSPPRGYLVYSATAQLPGKVIDSRTVDFGAVSAGIFENTVFTLGDPRPLVVDGANGPYFLIIAPESAINAGALDEYVEFKRRIGFQVEVKSLESIYAMYSSGNMREKVRNYEQNRLAAYGDRFRYLLIVSEIDTVPHATFYEKFLGYEIEPDDTLKVDLQACAASINDDNFNDKGVKLKRTDWYYADLVSDFDSNGNGCLLDGTRTESADRAPGYTPDQRPNFTLNVAVGRIPFSNASVIQKVLENITRFEQQSPAFKRQVLLALSLTSLKGQYWTPMDNVNGQYKACPVSESDKNDTTVSKDCRGSTGDAAYLGELLKGDFLNAQDYTSQLFYESVKPEGACPVQSPLPLTGNNVVDELNAKYYGFVNTAGHGSTAGVGRTHWVESNGNNIVDSPTQPSSGTSTNEIHGGDVMKTSMLNSMTPDNGRGSVYIAASCSTISPINPTNVGAEVLSQGHGVAWFGGLNVVGGGPKISTHVKGSNAVDYRITENLLRHNMRLGDALWEALLVCSSEQSSYSADISMALYGDPTLSYWGNPGGQATYAAWPMLRNDARGVGYSTLSGPSSPKELWTYDVNSPGTNRSPIVSNNGEVIVAHGNYIDVLRQGQLHQRLPLDSAIFGTPALSADGTIYALDNQGKLYAFAYASYGFFPIELWPSSVSSAQVEASGTRYRSWKVHVGSPSTSPIVGSDGYIGIGTTHRVVLVRPDGFVFADKIVPTYPILSIAMNADKSIVVTSGNGYSARIDFFCPGGGDCTTFLEDVGKPYSTPPLSIYGAVYAGRVNGEVVKLNSTANSVLATFQADGKILAGPIAGPAGQIVVTTDNGSVYSLTKDLALRWRRVVAGQLTGIPAFSIDALYVVSGNVLRAFHPHSGATLWAKNLGTNVGHGSVAVGYGREIYMETSGGKAIAYGEAWPGALAMVVAESTNAGAIRVSWFKNFTTVSGSALETEGDYLVQRRVSDGPWVDVAIVPAGTTEYVDTLPIGNDLPIAYRVKVIGTDGNDSDYILTIYEPKPLPALPHAPTWNAIEVVSADSLVLSWIAPPASQSLLYYRVERASNSGGPFELVKKTNADVTGVTDSGLQPNKQYFYRLIAINQSGESPPSAVSSQTTKKQNLPQPNAATAESQSNGSIVVRWRNPQGLPQGCQAEVEFSQGLMSGFDGMGVVPASAKSYSFLPGEDDIYEFRVKFLKGNSESPWAYTSALAVGSAAETGEHKVLLPSVFKR